MAELVFFRRSEEMMRVLLDGRRVSVGRGSSVDILVPDASVSRQQFALERDGEIWRLRDLSGRGTECTGARVEQLNLTDGIDIGLGQWRAVFNLGERAAAGEGATQLVGGDTAVRPTSSASPSALPDRLLIRSALGERSVPFQREMTVGTGEQCDVRLEDPFVSSAHLKLERRGGWVVARDLGSKNGLFLGGVRVWEAELPLDRPLQIGESELVLIRHRDQEPVAFEGLIGNDPVFRRVFETVERIAPSTAAVAVFGESGTGKELVARAIHNRSPRSAKTFLPVNCGAFSPQLVESELFGHEKGAFTGAERQRKGAFEEADGGTLFLDEVGELPLEMQAKLLRAVESGEIKRVGSSRPIHVDVRVVAATNRDLRQEIREGRFREDLYWRLTVIPLQLPPLRARRGDLRPLISHFLHMFSPPGAPVSLSKEAEQRLLDHDWPGNVRELKNTLHRSLMLRQGERIEERDIHFDRDLDAGFVASEPAPSYPSPADGDLNRVSILNKSLDEIGDEAILKTYRRVGSKATLAAKALSVSRGAVYRRLQKQGVNTGAEPGEDSEEP